MRKTIVFLTVLIAVSLVIAGCSSFQKAPLYYERGPGDGGGGGGSGVTYQGVLNMFANNCQTDSSTIPPDETVNCNDVCATGTTCVIGYHTEFDDPTTYESEITPCNIDNPNWNPNNPDNIAFLTCMCCFAA